MNKEISPHAGQFSHQYDVRPFAPIISRVIDFLPHLAHRVTYIDEESLQKIKEGGAILIAAPHTSHVDALITLYMLRDISLHIALLAGADYWDPAKRPFVPELMHKFNLIPVAREAGVPEGMKVANWNDIGQILKEGWNVFLFPEGTRDEAHRFQFEGGVVALSRRYKKPIIPIGLSGFQKILPKGERVPRIGRSVVMNIDRPIWEEDVPGWIDLALKERIPAFTDYLQKYMKVQICACIPLATHAFTISYRS